MPYLAVSILRSIFTAEKKLTAFWVYPLIFLASFIIGGFSEPTVLVMISLLALAIFCTWFWMKRPARKTAVTLLVLSFVGATLALTVMAVSLPERSGWKMPRLPQFLLSLRGHSITGLNSSSTRSAPCPADTIHGIDTVPDFSWFVRFASLHFNS